MPVGTVGRAGRDPYGPDMTRSKKIAIGIAAASIAGGAVVSLGPAASAPGAEVTRGRFEPFAAGAALDISGHAQLVRDRNGTTLVRIHVEGLTPGGSYASHVHKQACENGDADGHFQQHGPSAGTTPPNEIWPGDGPWTANPGGNASVGATVPYVANPDAVSAVVHDLSLPSTANKVACANLR
jgi:hypothetical protein